MAHHRKNTPNEHTWSVEKLYPKKEIWQEEIEVFIKMESDSWIQLTQHKEHLSKDVKNVKETLDHFFELERKLVKLYTWAHLKHDEDLTDDTYKIAFQQAQRLLFHFSEAASWIEPELLSFTEEAYAALLSDPSLVLYRFYFQRLRRMQPHTLTTQEERLLAMGRQPMQTANRAFSALNDADIYLPNVKDSNNTSIELTHALYASHLRSSDRTLRENTFKTYHAYYNAHANTLAELLQGKVLSHTFEAHARKYSSSLESALFPNQIDTKVYTNLIETVNAHLDVHHRYIALRKKTMNVDSLHFWDLHVPLIENFDIKIPYDEAVDLVIASVAPLGPDYQKIVQQGLKEERWVDRFENLNKRSGAYSSGCFDSYPYILMNYRDLLRDVFTLAHEMGHSMHSHLSHTTQPYPYSHYPIFLAEVASTFNENLLSKLLLERASSKDAKLYLINQQIEDIRATLFRQTMFSEFELSIHQMGEQGAPLTPTTLSRLYLDLNKKYFGNTLEMDEEISIEWARIPHFYYNFYVYQYATGISAAHALSDHVEKGGKEALSAYFNFLKGGSSKYPIELLTEAGVDMRSPKPIEAAIQKFDDLVSEFEKLRRL